MGPGAISTSREPKPDSDTRVHNITYETLLYFYCTVIRTVLEYACPAWHTNLTLEETTSLEDVQRRALSIIFGLGDYDDQC